MSLPKWQSLQRSADRRRKSADHEKAIESYTQALDRPDVPWEAVVEMTMARADSYKMLGRFKLAEASLTSLAEKASDHGDDATMVRATAELLIILRKSGDLKRGLQLGQEMLRIAERTGQPELKADALLSLGFIQVELGEHQAAQACLTEATALIAPDEKVKQLKAIYLKCLFLSYTGRYQDILQFTKEAVEIARSIGDKDWEGIALNGLASSYTDLTLRRKAFGQALEAFEAAGDRPFQAIVTSNSSDLWIEVGLYKRASELAQRALVMARETEQDVLMVYCLQNLGGSSVGMGDLNAAVKYFSEGITKARKIGLAQMEHVLWTFLGNNLMLLGELDKASDAFKEADSYPHQQNQGLNTFYLTLRAGLKLLSGNSSEARQDALQLLEGLNNLIDGLTQDVPIPLICWWCYRALASTKKNGRPNQKISKQAWLALELGIKGLLIPIENLSDAGLRRGYLHRLLYRRLLIQEWLKFAPSQGVNEEQIADFTNQVQKPGRLDEVFGRLLKVGVRLNAERDPARLPEEMVEEVDELTGAERIALILLDENGKRRLVKTRLPRTPFAALTGKAETPPNPEAFISEIEPWLEETMETRQGFIRQLNTEAGPLEQRSILTAPLISQGKLLGLIYCDLRGSFGRFDPEDLNLLGVLANQSAVAVENADWSATLEQKVTDRTDELKQSNDWLEQRNGELSIINEIQQGLASKLEYKAILELVGSRIDKIFASISTSIVLYEPETDMLHKVFSLSEGIRDAEESWALGPGITSHVIQTSKPVLIHTFKEGTAYGAIISRVGNVDDGTQINSAIFVPLFSGEQVKGVIRVSKLEENAFDESDVRLLSMLVNSMSVALENAHLFEETQRLLRETEQRAAELAILNSVGDAMSSQLDIKTITHLVGDKVREIFSSEVVLIYLFDPKTNILHPPYTYDRGYIDTDSMDTWDTHATTDPIHKAIILDRKSLLFGNLNELLEIGTQIWPDAAGGEGATNSFMGVPIIVGEQVRGLVSVQSYRENAYDESNLRLLSTLAASMGVAIENARLFQAEQERISELEIINSIQQGLAKELTFQAIVDLVGDKLSEVLHTDNLGIWWHDEKANLLHFLYDFEHGNRLSRPPVTPKPGSAPIEPYVINTLEEMKALEHVPGTDEAKSGVTIPIFVSDRVIGAIHDENFEREYAYGESELRLLTTIAASLGNALENARLFDETQRLLKETEQRNAELAVINTVQAALAAELDIQGIYDAVGDKIREIFHSDNISIRIYDPIANLVSTPYIYEKGARIYLEPVLVTEENKGKGFTGYVIKNRETLVINENMDQAMEKYGSYTMPGTEAEKSAVYVPLIIGEAAYGLVNLSDMEHEHAFSESDVRLLQTLVNSMSVALENARLFDETQRLVKAEQERVAELEIINSIQQGLAKELNFQAIVDLVGDKLREVFNTPDLIIAWYEERADLMHSMYVYEHGQRLSIPSTKPTISGPFSRMRQTRQPVIWNTAEEGDKVTGGVIPGTDRSQSGVMIPVISGDRVLGIIQLENYARESAFGEAELRLLTTIAASLGSALENARLFDETQRLLKETEQRNSELAVINSIQQGLAAQIEIQAIFNLVGDKIREIFDAQVVLIDTLDFENKIVTNHYLVENGKHYFPPPLPLFKLHEWIQQTHEIVVFNQDAAKHCLEFGIPVAPGTKPPKSALFVPLLVGENVTGVISLQNIDKENAFDDSSVHLLSTLANSMSVALENARLFDETQRLLKETEQRNAELGILNSVSDALSKNLNVDAIIKIVGDQVRDTFKAEVTTIHLYDPSNNLISTPYAYDRGYIHPSDFAFGEGLTSRVIQRREPLVLLTAAEAVAYGTLLIPDAEGEEGNTESYLAVPIILGDKVIGVVSVQSYQQNAYQANHVSLLSTLASTMGVAIANARQFQAEQERVAELEIINSIQKGLAEELDFQAIIDLVGDKLREVFKTGDLGISWWDEKANLVHYMYTYEHGKRIMAPPAPPMAGGIYETEMRTRRPYIMGANDISKNPPMPGTDASLSAAFVPIISSDRFLGDISVESYLTENAFGEAEIRLLTTIAASLGSALENARLFNETQRLLKETEQRAAELAILNSVGDAMSRQLDVKTISDLVGDKVREIFASEAVIIWLYDPKTQRLHAPYAYDRGYIPAEQLDLFDGDLDNPIKKAIVLDRKSLLFGTSQELVDAGAAVYASVNDDDDLTCSFMGVPIIVGEQVRGVVSVQSYREHAYDTSNLRLLSTLASSMGVAIENARLFQETQRLLNETEQRAAELQIINSVQAALAAELDIQGIYDAVGDKIREIFHTGNVAIRIYDPKTNLLHVPYLYENSSRIILHPVDFNFSGFTGHVMRTRETLVINENIEEAMEQYGAYVLPGTTQEKSCVWVPMVVGGQGRGVVALADFDHEHAFSESDVRLLQTLVNSMSVALENARLFNETQRLLAETEQRNSELAIINSVQAALAAELNIQGIYDAVGDKIREIFNSDNLEIRIWDPRTNLEYLPYLYEKGERIEVEAVPREDKGFGAYISRTRETLVINENILQEVEKYGSYLVPGTELARSIVYVPLVVGDQVRGMIGLADFEREHAFSESDVRLLQTLVNSMSVALENARLFNETQRLLEETSQRANELSIINHVSQSMSRQLQVESIVRTVGDQVRDTLHSEVVNLYLYDAANKTIHLPYSWDRAYVETEPFPYGKGLTSKILDTRQPMILSSFEDIVEAGALLNPNSPADELMPQSYLGVPIVVGEKAIGAIDVQSYTKCVYDDSHVRLLTTLASSMGVALENARLFEETRRLLAETEARNRELAIISRVGQALAGQLDPQGIYELVGEELQRVFDTQVVSIITYDRQENLAYWRYSIEKGVRQTISPRVPLGFSGHILRTREPLLLTHDVDKWAEQYGSKVVAGEAPKSYLGVPLIAGGEVTGLIALQNIDREEAFNENDLRLLSTLALNMGVALENARLYQETQHHAVEMAALAEIGSDIASTHEMEPVLERMATKTRELMEVRDIALYLLQPDGQTLKPIVSQGKYAGETMAQPIFMGIGMTGSVAQSGVAEIINEPELDSRAVHIAGTPLETEEAECLIVAPLISRGRVIGVISVYRDREQGSFTQIELDFLVSLARQAAIAIESARLYAETERRATEMAALAEVSREISATLELQVVLERIAGQALDLLAAPNSAVYLLQPDGETIKAIAAEGDIAQEVMVDEIKLGAGMIGSIIESGRAEWIDNTARDPRAIHIAGTKDIDDGEKLLIAPLLTQDRAIGALAVWRNPADPTFNQAELNFAINLAQQAVVAIENARLFEAAQESQRQMADIIDFLPDATFVVDREGKVIAWNHAIEEMTGVKAEDILGKGDYEYSLPFYEERRPVLIDMVLLPDEEIEKKYSHIQRTDGVLVGETIAPVLRGRIAYLNATASALIDSKGDVVGAIESIRDITDQKKAEQELHQAKADAEAANQAKSAFLAMMSHEIRTPMNAIIGMSGLLMDTQLNPDQREFAETIRSSGDSLLTIINDILDFSKVEAGKMTLEEVPFDLRECVEASLDLVKVRASEKNLELAYQIEAGVPRAILGDVTRLRQVLINLLGNSVKFTEQGEIILTVSKADEENCLHFSVRDTGIGIPPDRIGLLFRAFTQADASTSRRYGGTGLGLALSNRIVGLMGGRIWVESEGIPGKGSIFHFIISAKSAPDLKGHPYMEGEQFQLRGKRLLLVDDNATNRRILQLQTQAWGMISKECASPVEALEIMRNGEGFDLAIIDMQMPDMSGVELADEIRKLEAGKRGAKRMPLVLSTSLGGREEGRESSDFAAILLKPIRQSALYDMLMSLFAGQASLEEKPATEKATLDPQMANRHPLRILLAEDNVVNQKLALRLLSQMGYRTDIAANGLEVLQAVKRQPYDVILMDVQMPEMDGLEATRRLCAEIPKGKRPRIIAMTANAMQGDREMCLEAGMDDYLSKPIRVDELVAALNQAGTLSAG